MEYLTFHGSIVLSSIRSRNLASKLGVSAVKARFIHYVALKGSHGREKQADYDKSVFEGLFGCGGDDDLEDDSSKRDGDEDGADIFFVYPRSGTISPWSSKATSIAQICGLSHIVHRIERGTIVTIIPNDDNGYDKSLAANLLHDRMTETLSSTAPDLEKMFAQSTPAPLRYITMHAEGNDPRDALRKANKTLGLALDESEIEYLVKAYASDGPMARDPTDVELFMFAQVNSEHCRHKQFNASWTIDGVEKPYSLIDMIRNTHAKSPAFTISAYSDNAAVFEGQKGSFFASDRYTREWKQTVESVPFLGKVETHNHPTSIVPYEGAATGSGGEIRDEGAVGRGSRSKAGLSGFAVSDLLIPNLPRPWELTDLGYPNHIASSLDIMLNAPLGSAAFNNEFGRPCLTGCFRTLLIKIPIGDGREELRGYHKPIMLAGGIGNVRSQHALKDPEIVGSGAYLIVMGGPAMLIGLGGGAASSQTSVEESKDLDFASVQRANAEVQRRAQEVINACVAMGSENPIEFIHDVGAGGLSNALPELVHDTDNGGTFELREIDNADRGMSPMQIWCNESQERYVLAVGSDGLNVFKSIADRERCGYSVVGRAKGEPTPDKRLVLTDRESNEHPKPIDIPMSILFGKPPKIARNVKSRKLPLGPFDNSLKAYLPGLKSGFLEEAVSRVLQLPAVASKMFLITIGDRTVGGLTCRDQLVGPWQTPVADCSVTATSLTPGIRSGEAMAMGEKPTVALIDPAASAKMAVAEALMNIAPAHLVDRLKRIKLSANWMTSINSPGEAAAIYDAVHAIAMVLCPELEISIPVGKDSTSMKMGWIDPRTKEVKEVTSPLSLVVTAFAPVLNTRNTWTPALRRPSDVGETVLLYVDLALGRKAMGGSALAQVFGQIGNDAPDVRNVQLLKDYFDGIEQLHEAGIVLSYHDISDGGLFTCLTEMAIAGRCGINVILDDICSSTETADIVSTLFNEELGTIFQVSKKEEINFKSCFATCGPPDGLIKKIGSCSSSSPQELVIYHRMDLIYRSPISKLHETWSSTSYEMAKLRDNSACAESEYKYILDREDPGLSFNLTFNPAAAILPFTTKLSNRLSLTAKPRIAILRAEGTNGHAEMAFAFTVAGFVAVDVHMTDLFDGRTSLADYTGLAACGGFSYGDVLGAGQGWAKSVLLHKELRQQFVEFFARKETFTLGVCNGCQFLTRLKSLIPGAEAWPSFQRNISEQYEARYCEVEILDDVAAPSVFLHEMKGTTMPIALGHGEGRAHFKNAASQSAAAEALVAKNLVSIRYVDNYLKPTEQYPANPNGSPLGIGGLRSADGRVLAMMPHPERCVANPGSWIPPDAGKWGDFGPWVRIFQSARRWVG